MHAVCPCMQYVHACSVSMHAVHAMHAVLPMHAEESATDTLHDCYTHNLALLRLLSHTVLCTLSAMAMLVSQVHLPFI